MMKRNCYICQKIYGMFYDHSVLNGATSGLCIECNDTKGAFSREKYLKSEIEQQKIGFHNNGHLQTNICFRKKHPDPSVLQSIDSNDDIEWLKITGQILDEPRKISKLYLPKESWTRKRAWWFEFSEKQILKPKANHILFLCGTGELFPCLHYLRIPVSFFVDYRESIGFRKKEKRYSLFFSAEPDNLFQEMRGKERIDFSKFQMDETLHKTINIDERHKISKELREEMLKVFRQFTGT